MIQWSILILKARYLNEEILWNFAYSFIISVYLKKYILNAMKSLILFTWIISVLCITIKPKTVAIYVYTSITRTRLSLNNVSLNSWIYWQSLDEFSFQKYVSIILLKKNDFFKLLRNYQCHKFIRVSLILFKIRYIKIYWWIIFHCWFSSNKTILLFIKKIKFVTNYYYYRKFQNSFHTKILKKFQLRKIFRIKLTTRNFKK